MIELIKEINESLREKDPVELALEACKKHEEEEEATSAASCKQYMDPSRANDFAKAIAGMMDKGASYGDAKAQAFDETEMPPPNSPCCAFIRSRVAELRKTPVKESYVLTYDQVPSGEEKEEFGSIEQAKQFAIKRLNGKYNTTMSDNDFTRELKKNGYFINKSST